jgi:predicted DNA-binding transcriptional regulator AlpA
MADIPEYASIKTIARQLDCGQRTVTSLVDRGILPQPLRIGGLVRWNWAAVIAQIDPKTLTDVPEPANADQIQEATGDPILRAVQNAS